MIKNNVQSALSHRYFCVKPIFMFSLCAVVLPGVEEDAHRFIYDRTCVQNACVCVCLCAARRNAFNGIEPFKEYVPD